MKKGFFILVDCVLAVLLISAIAIFSATEIRLATLKTLSNGAYATVVLVTFIIIAGSTNIASLIDKEYTFALLYEKEGADNFPFTLFAIRTCFMFAWVIPHLVVLLVLSLVRAFKYLLGVVKDPRLVENPPEELQRGMKYLR